MTTIALSVLKVLKQKKTKNAACNTQKAFALYNTIMKSVVKLIKNAMLAECCDVRSI